MRVKRKIGASVKEVDSDGEKVRLYRAHRNTPSSYLVEAILTATRSMLRVKSSFRRFTDVVAQQTVISTMVEEAKVIATVRR